MSEAPDSGRTPAERVDDIPRMLAAMRQAVREALLDHARAGNPVAVWRDEQVVWIQPEDIPAELARPSEAEAVDELDPARD